MHSVATQNSGGVVDEWHLVFCKVFVQRNLDQLGRLV